jgi:glutathione S-transferase
MFILHHLNSSRSQRLVWMFELLKLDYEITVYQRDATTNLAPSSLKAIHPLGTAPIISHNGNNIVETGAICEYIVKEAKDTTLIPPKEHEDFVNVQFW